MDDNVKNEIRKHIKRNSQQVMWDFFDLLLEYYKKTYKTPVEMLESDIQVSFNIWNPTKEHCSQCGSSFPDRADFKAVGYDDFKTKKFCSFKSAENWLDDYGKNTKPPVS